MPLRFLQKWPKSYGFEIYGKGPCYVMSVEKGSMAHKAGLMPGDQILEVDGCDVTTLTAEQLKSSVKSRSGRPPALEVVSCLLQVIIRPDHPLGFGFTVQNDKPTRIGAVSYGGPAYIAGLRAGDVILEANSNSPVSIEMMGTLLSQRYGKLTLLVIPVGRASNLIQVDKNLSRIPAPDPRVHKARDLHIKLEGLLGNDYKGKVAVISSLKRYAEDRDIPVLCRSLNDVLRTKQQRSILTQIRLLIPPIQRQQFDDIMNVGQGDSGDSISSRPSSTMSKVTTSHSLGQKKIIQILRESGSFGFVIKSSKPAFIESVDVGGAADQAGLKAGDYLIKLNGIDVRKCEHEKLVQLLQDSGSAPTLEILRCTKNDRNRSLAASSLSTSSSSSHGSSDNILYRGLVIDARGDSFIERATFLLTPRERNALKKAIRHYDMTRDVVTLYDRTSRILDTPSQKMLWPFIFVLLSAPHREYISHRVSLSKEVLMEIVNNDGGYGANLQGDVNNGGGISDFPPSFQQQIDFLLTSTERLQFKNCLKEYGRNPELSLLVKTLEEILDTPSKRILWRLVLPRLTHGHREVMKARLDLHGRQTASAPLNLTGMDSYIGMASHKTPEASGAHVDTATNTENQMAAGSRAEMPDFEDLFSSSDDDRDGDSSEDSDSSIPDENSRMKKKSKASYDPLLMKEIEETKKAVQEMREALMLQEKGKESAEEIGSDSDLEKDLAYLEARRYVTIIPIGYRKGKDKKGPYAYQATDAERLYALKKEGLDVYESEDYSMSLRPRRKHNDTFDSSSAEENDAEENGYQYNFTSNGRGLNQLSSARSEMSALLELDAAMAEETSDPDWSPRDQEKHSADNDLTAQDQENPRNPTTSIPPPPPPPPPPLPSSDMGMEDLTGKMSVKRINWEKLDNRRLENTIWEKLHYQDLSDLVRFLELETQFSTKPTRKKGPDGKKEILIMDHKKAYNISILLGHLKMSVTEVRQAIYNMDEHVLTFELIKQLLAYAPSEHEISQYKSYKGNISSLTNPDQFAYQLSQIGDYEQRLKALLFKLSFREKIDEMRQNLEAVKNASQELKNSKKLARLLEVILAMGNYMNKGNSRVGEAAGFRISFLTQLDITKTADQKSSFLHVLAEAAYNKFPEVLSLSTELPTVDKAAKVSIADLNEEAHDLRKALEETSAVLEQIEARGHIEPGDRFQDVIGHFIAEASDEIQSVFRLQATAMTAFSDTVTFFGEDPKTMSTTDVFTIFSEFIKNFEKAHRHNLMFKR